MADIIPKTMRALCVFSYTTPSNYQIATVDAPKVTAPTHVLIKVYAASINPTDTFGARGAHKFAVSATFPYVIGYDVSGVVAQVGEGVTKWKVGDEVFCCLPVRNRGAICEYAVTTEDILARKPKNISHIQAAALPLVTLTALQMFERVSDGVERKTILIPAGLSGVGSVGCQLAKNVFGAAKVITTVSTEKVSKVDELLGKGIVDQIVDYKKEDPLQVIPKMSVDILFDTAGVSLSYALLVSKSGIITSCTAGGPSQDLKAAVPEAYWLAITLMSYIYVFIKWRIQRQGPNFEGMLLVSRGKELERVREYVEEGKLRSVVGQVIKLEDIEKIREVCEQMVGCKGKGGLGKVVVEVCT